ncbi:TY5A [Symbiodinium sp. CCMP2456]|nr:TY5A [Symbiodinium sp. CCMP2456]
MSLSMSFWPSSVSIASCRCLRFAWEPTEESDGGKNMIAGLLSMQRMSAGRLKRFEARGASPQELPMLANGRILGYQDGVRACDLIEEIGQTGGNLSLQAIRNILKEFPRLDTRGLGGLGGVECIVVIP